MSNYALELLQDHYEAACEELNEIWKDEENTFEIIEALQAKHKSLHAALIKLGGLQ